MSKENEKSAQIAVRESLTQLHANLLKTSEKLRKAGLNYKQAAEKIMSSH
ncbi:hypothetical protein [Vibrio salinus]|nr:hypothetical protein [Vibrio salinus]MCE0494819.1 hypothetical protein [Vibrio salinus]